MNSVARIERTEGIVRVIDCGSKITFRVGGK